MWRCIPSVSALGRPRQMDLSSQVYIMRSCLKEKKRENLCVCPHMWMWVCAHECRSPQKPEVLDSLELELQVILSHLTWVLGNRTWDHCKSSMCSYPLSHVVSSLMIFLKKKKNPKTQLTLTCASMSTFMCCCVWSQLTAWGSHVGPEDQTLEWTQVIRFGQQVSFFPGLSCQAQWFFLRITLCIIIIGV